MVLHWSENVKSSQNNAIKMDFKPSTTQLALRVFGSCMLVDDVAATASILTYKAISPLTKTKL